MANPEITTPHPVSAPANRKEMSLQKILVVTDYSREASDGIDHAIKIAKLTGAHVALLHVVELRRSEINPELVAAVERIQSNIDHLRQQAMKHPEEICKEIRASGINCTVHVRLGIPYEEILDEAEKTNPDLLVIGRKGTSGLARFLLGSTTERVVRHAPCSVLVARA
jgi:nucleotide-binding universal stress UspA family protein